MKKNNKNLIEDMYENFNLKEQNKRDKREQEGMDQFVEFCTQQAEFDNLSNLHADRILLMLNTLKQMYDKGRKDVKPLIDTMAEELAFRKKFQQAKMKSYIKKLEERQAEGENVERELQVLRLRLASISQSDEDFGDKDFKNKNNIDKNINSKR